MTEAPVYEPKTVVPAQDGSLHPSVDAARAHDQKKALEAHVVAFTTAAGIKGRAKRAYLDAISDFLAWNQAGKPDKWGSRADEANDPA